MREHLTNHKPWYKSEEEIKPRHPNKFPHKKPKHAKRTYQKFQYTTYEEIKNSDLYDETLYE